MASVQAAPPAGPAFQTNAFQAAAPAATAFQAAATESPLLQESVLQAAPATPGLQTANAVPVSPAPTSVANGSELSFALVPSGRVQDPPPADVRDQALEAARALEFGPSQTGRVRSPRRLTDPYATEADHRTETTDPFFGEGGA